MRKLAYDEAYYEDINAQTLERMRPKYAKFLSYLPAGLSPRAILDLGCGSGTLCAYLAERFPEAEVAGTDQSELALQTARERCPGLRFRTGDVSAPPPAEETERYDLITSHEVIEHLHDGAAFVRSIFQMLTPGGWVLLKTPNALDLWRLLAPVIRRPWYADADQTHVRYYHRFDGAKLLRSCGFVAVRAFTGTRPLFPRLPLPAPPVVGAGLVLRGMKPGG